MEALDADLAARKVESEKLQVRAVTLGLSIGQPSLALFAFGARTADSMDQTCGMCTEALCVGYGSRHGTLESDT